MGGLGGDCWEGEEGVRGRELFSVSRTRVESVKGAIGEQELRLTQNLLG